MAFNDIQSDSAADWFSTNDPGQSDTPATTPAGPKKPGDPGTYIARDGHWYDDQGNDLGDSGQAPNPVQKVGGDGGILGPAVRPADGGGGGGGNNNGGGPDLTDILAPFKGSFNFGRAPVAGVPPPFAPSRPMPIFKSFTNPTLDEAKAEPGFQLSQQMGQQGIENSAAGRGLLRSGGTLKDILQYNQNFANQNYQNVYNRDFNTWQANTSGDLGNWLTGTQADLNTYNTNYQTQVKDPFQNALASTSMDNSNDWQNFLQQYQIFTNNQKWPYQVLSDQQKIGAQAASGG